MRVPHQDSGALSQDPTAHLGSLGTHQAGLSDQDGRSQRPQGLQRALFLLFWAKASIDIGLRRCQCHWTRARVPRKCPNDQRRLCWICLFGVWLEQRGVAVDVVVVFSVFPEATPTVDHRPRRQRPTRRFVIVGIGAVVDDNVAAPSGRKVYRRKPRQYCRSAAQATRPRTGWPMVRKNERKFTKG